MIVQLRKYLPFLPILLILLFFTAPFIADHVESSDPAGQQSNDDRPSALASELKKGEFPFRVRIRDHMISANSWFAEVRVYPSQERFPNIRVERDSTLEASVRVILKIAGIEVPPPASDFYRWHRATEREESRFDASMHYTWRLLSASEYCVIANPKDIGGLIEGDVYVVIGGVRLNLADRLVEDGFALREENIDWGLRHPRSR